ncbi:sugar phosphate nucleotidyltransferase [Oscillibacter sp. 1-3]|uniref:sugar phosphate nucleotidyltransferase n=1 Tax=Oscillibacter sp. 1-3 TaxID=1235797 RepID=UPI00033FB135|nr:sugar phosphate nucleotidyltransferase [Oscillibacter sp. 1-3]EOS66684.1 hypothetical protein C816_00830 [Oscillibacter sp. 1-3]
MNHSELCVSHTTTIRDAMRQLNSTAKKIIFVLNDDKLYGTLTDGDIRRFLLAGGRMDALAADAAHLHPRTAENAEQARALLRGEGGDLTAVPVVKADNTLVDILLGPDSAQTSPLPQLALPVVIMAGGMGKRLDPYTRILPKPLIPIGDLPIIEHIMQRFLRYGCTEFHIVVNYKKGLLKAYFNDSQQDYHICWYDEVQPLGTGGGLSLLKGRLDKTFFFTNCDILLRSDYAKMAEFHQTNHNAVTIVGACKNMTIPYGVVEMGKGGVITAFREKPELSFLTNTGLYLVEPEVLEDIPEDKSQGFPDIIEGQRQKGRRTAVYPVSEEEWLDMGQMEELEKMRRRFGEG